jgi:rhodanese-related sulfurtransferase
MLLPMRSHYLLTSTARKLVYLASATFITAMFVFGQQGSKQEEILVPGRSKNLVQTADLLKALKSSGTEKPLVLYVGPHTFYQQAHITGAEFVGPASRAEGMEKLRARAGSLPHDKPIVLYCGCCPWDHCPNVRPAFRELQKMGFKNVRVLYLPTSFGTDWADKGYPTAKGE